MTVTMTMSTPTSNVRQAVLVATTLFVIGACGGSSDDAAPSGGAGQAGVVLDTAPVVESAVAASTTTETIEPTETAAAPEPDTTPEPVATPAPETAPPATAPATSPAPTAVTTPATTEPPETESTGVPVGYRPIVDDSGELRANVPAEWSDTNGAPDGVLRQLSAAPDLAGFLGGYAQPGMVLITGEAATPDAWMDGLAATLGIAESDGCTVSDTSEYDDGVYTGTEHLLSCGTSASVAHLIGGRNTDGDLFFLLALVRPSDEPDVRDEIVQSFFID